MRYPLHYLGIIQGHHQGKCIDFGWNYNQDGPNAEVYSIDDGVVTFAGVENKSGNVIYIKHSNGMIANYAHLSKMVVKKGDTVKMGQHIGNMGCSGVAKGNHLHLSIWSSMDAYYKDTGHTDVDPIEVLEVYPDNTMNDSTRNNYNLRYHKEDVTPDPVDPPEPTPQPEEFKVGDKVVPTRLVNYTGTKLKQYDKSYTITELVGDRAVLSARGQVWAAMNIKDIKHC